MEQIKQKLDLALANFKKEDIQAVAIDIDGTLINSDRECSQYTIDTVKKLIETGKEVYIVTGRAIKTAKKFADQVGIKDYMINSNGAVIWNVKDSSIEFESPIQEDIAVEIIKLCKERDIMNIAYMSEDFYYDADDNVYMIQYNKFAPISGVKQDLLTVNHKRIQKFFIMNSEEVITKLHDEIAAKYGDKLSLLLTTPHLHNLAEGDFPARCIEIMGGNINKGNTLQKLAELRNIDMKNIVAFGDDVNDIEMLQQVGWGVAMDNARPRVKEATSLGTLSNNDDGVAYFIEKYLL